VSLPFSQSLSACLGGEEDSVCVRACVCVCVCVYE
jgi:hypothetical protein